ncbi:unnamed protein product [Microthlaspi erraticum]|uniref:Transmembrane protein n=1 Tax=Microthlaspi erraticum TaxID=1685480 RepID=A0A6D2HU41_9BRAS|nr:unnamed protein product [Microthlaspi erraticum]
MAKELTSKAHEAFVDDDLEIDVDLYSKVIELDPNCADFFADRVQANIKLLNFTEEALLTPALSPVTPQSKSLRPGNPHQNLNNPAKKDELGCALTVLSSSISASTFMASIALTLSSLIGAWIGSSPVNMTVFTGHFVYGDTSSITMVIKYTSLLICFLVAFCCFVQSTRSFLHANYLITTPGEDIPPEMVKRAVLRGGNFWSIGLRALYLALNLLLWLFGPIPMFVNSVLMVVCLYYLDTNSVVQPLYHRTFQAEQTVKRMRGVLPEQLTFTCN